MKKQFSILGAITIAMISFSSCTKNIKDDLRSAQQNIDSLKKINEELRNVPGSLESLIGSDQPLIALTTFEDNNGATRAVRDTFFYKEHNSFNSRMTTRENGTIDVRIQRYSGLDYNEFAYIRFNYDPVSKKAQDIICYHNWIYPSTYGESAYYSNQYGAGLTMDVNISKFDVNTGDISIVISATGDGSYTQAAASTDPPNPGKPMSTKFSFTGKLIKYNTGL